MISVIRDRRTGRIRKPRTFLERIEKHSFAIGVFVGSFITGLSYFLIFGL